MLFRWFENLIDPYEDAPVEMPPQKFAAFIWYYMKPFRWLLLGTVLVSIAMAVLELAVFDFVGRLVDWLGTTDRAGFWESHGDFLTLMGLAVIIGWPLFALIDDLINHQGVLGNSAMMIRWRAHRYLLRQSMNFFANDFAGRLANKVMQTAVTVRDTVLTMVNIFVYVGVYFFGAIGLFAANDWRLIIPVAVWLLFYIAIIRFFLPRIGKLSEAQSEARSQLNGRIVDAYTNIQTVKMFADSGAEDDFAREGMDNMMATIIPQMRLFTLLSVCLHGINGLLIATTLGLGLYLWTEGHIEAGALALAGGLLMRLQGISHWFLWEVARLFEGLGMIADGQKTLAQPIALTDPEYPAPFAVPHGEVHFDRISFHYGKKTGVIEDFSLLIEAGQKVGLVGRSGAGKSTLVNLLLRLHDVEKGSILIDGQNIRDITQADLRRHIAMVTQDTSLLHRSIRDNIAYGMPEASEASIIRAAERAEAHQFIPELSDGKGRTGYDAHVGERGVKLSGGQRQRIAIARVILKNAPVLVLDEATSALDSEAEAAIQSQFHELMVDKTVIAIAHRLSTIAEMDRLVVIDRGQIIEDGTHDELVAAGGIYADLWSRQSGGFLPADVTSAAE